jgi:hypothetical protein
MMIPNSKRDIFLKRGTNCFVLLIMLPSIINVPQKMTAIIHLNYVNFHQNK